MYSDQHKSITVFLRDTKTVAGAFKDTKMIACILIAMKVVAGAFIDTNMVADIMRHENSSWCFHRHEDCS